MTGNWNSTHRASPHFRVLDFRVAAACARGMLTFQLHPSRTEILAARDRYLVNTAEMARENKAFVAGDLIAAGDLDPQHLIPIIDWKSSRPKSRIEGNNPADVIEALRIARSAQRDRTAVAVLCGLRGVDVAMASAMLTAMNRERFTVIDWRALKALGVEKSWLTTDDYLEYLAYCRAKAIEYQISLRDLDRAWWQVGGQ